MKKPLIFMRSAAPRSNMVIELRQIAFAKAKESNTVQ